MEKELCSCSKMQESRTLFFFDGESPLKHSKDLFINNTKFKWKYPIWYSTNIEVYNCHFDENARAGIWYTNNIFIKDTIIDAPKLFRRCKDVTLENVKFNNSMETFWECDNIKLNNVVANENYFGMNSNNIVVDNFTLNGNYPFDGSKNIKIYNSTLNSKDAFWNTEDVYIENSTIRGEYFAWNSKNVTLVNCIVESLQGFCFVENLVMKNCKLENTTLAFEYSNIDCEINGSIGSVKNPLSGRLICDNIDELILESDKVNINDTKIIQTKG